MKERLKELMFALDNSRPGEEEKGRRGKRKEEEKKNGAVLLASVRVAHRDHTDFGRCGGWFR
jgi:hypothetical protein